MKPITPTKLCTGARIRHSFIMGRCEYCGTSRQEAKSKAKQSRLEKEKQGANL